MRFGATAATLAFVRSWIPLQPLPPLDVRAWRAGGSIFFGWIGDVAGAVAAAGGGGGTVSASPGFVMNHSYQVGPQVSSNLCSMRTSKPLLRKKLTWPRVSFGQRHDHRGGDNKKNSRCAGSGSRHTSELPSTPCSCAGSYAIPVPYPATSGRCRTWRGSTSRERRQGNGAQSEQTSQA